MVGTHKVVQAPACLSQQGCLRFVEDIERAHTTLHTSTDWYIKLEMTTGKHDKFYILGVKRPAQARYPVFYTTTDSYIQMEMTYGRNGTSGVIEEHGGVSTLAYKLFEKMAKGYKLTTDIPRSESRFPNVASGQQPFDVYTDGTTHDIDLSIVSPMFQLVKSFRYCAQEDQFKAHNASGQYIMSVPLQVMKSHYKLAGGLT